MSDQIGALLSVLADQPALTGALCRDTPRLHDWDWDIDDQVEPRPVRAERHRRAADICDACPVFAKCEEWSSTLTPGEVPGVIAGAVHNPSKKTVTRLTRPRSVA
ncbi:WhiB family transcriptional regulator [Rhodococcoides fascians]|uniref:WhiB family transcriptional regulator n=1 Tax=Rhodococcoides fascians TaxID=1828 RepID=UPI00055E71B0|nr:MULTISPECIES: WhiB family transcriptional regulator [Rhodococcus]OZF00555.1 hypothetical protein CH301_12805 [Rhodococcus sp. 15-1189-1-1a]OZF14434.1 hypothetical protein CH299_13485 [Rhodococcus sp. 14-2686-1-2]